MKDVKIFMAGNCMTPILITRTKNIHRYTVRGKKIDTVGEIIIATTKKRKNIMLPLKIITTSLQIIFFVSYNEDKISKLNKHLGNIINNALEIKKMINRNQLHFHIVKYIVNIM